MIRHVLDKPGTKLSEKFSARLPCDTLGDTCFKGSIFFPMQATIKTNRMLSQLRDTRRLKPDALSLVELI
jgi:hypothetical protein